jgi:hypothetical protein
VPGAQVEGAQCATPGAQCALEGIENAAQADIAVQERGVRIQEACLIRLEIAVQKADDPREIKIISEATSLAIASIRRIRGLDTPTPVEASDIEAAIEFELAQLAASRQASDPPKLEGEEPSELEAAEGTADPGIQRQG